MAVPFAKKAYKGAAPSKEWNVDICSNMEGRILSKINQTEIDKYCMISLIESKIPQSREHDTNGGSQI